MTLKHGDSFNEEFNIICNFEFIGPYLAQYNASILIISNINHDNYKQICILSPYCHTSLYVKTSYKILFSHVKQFYLKLGSYYNISSSANTPLKIYQYLVID